MPFPSVPESRRREDPALYQSPVQYQCQRNFVVLLTDGEPTSDSTADDKIAALPGFSQLGRASCDGEGDGHCLDDMAEYLNSAADLAPDVPGRQNAITYTIGFGPEVAGSTFLDGVAARGGGRSFAANDVTQLTAALQSIFGDILQSGSTFVAPSVSVNAFNRTQANNELFVSVFKPDDSLRWPGNVKKYGIQDGRIVDATGAEVVDPATGFLRDGTRSLWSATREDDAVLSGGAASRLPAAPQRRLLHLHRRRRTAGSHGRRECVRDHERDRPHRRRAEHRWHQAVARGRDQLGARRRHQRRGRGRRPHGTRALTRRPAARTTGDRDLWRHGGTPDPATAWSTCRPTTASCTRSTRAAARSSGASSRRNCSADWPTSTATRASRGAPTGWMLTYAC